MDWKQKLTSRKFWVTIANFVTMLAIALGAAEHVASKVAAIIMAGGGVVAYIVGEGLADAAHVEDGQVLYTIEDDGGDEVG